MVKVREVFFYFYNTPNNFSYIPLAPVSETTPTSKCYVYNEPVFPLYNKIKQQVGFITWRGETRVDPLLNGSKIHLNSETGLIYTTNDKSLDANKILGSLSYSYTYLTDDTGLYINDKKIQALYTSSSGKYNNKVIKITDRTINNKLGKNKIIIEYDE